MAGPVRAASLRALRGQGWAGATADTDGATWTPTPGHTPPALHLALNRPFRRRPGMARPRPSDGLPLFHHHCALVALVALPIARPRQSPRPASSARHVLPAPRPSHGNTETRCARGMPHGRRQQRGATASTASTASTLRWPKASLAARCTGSPTKTKALWAVAGCRRARLRAWHLIATWTVPPPKLLLPEPAAKVADSLRSQGPPSPERASTSNLSAYFTIPTTQPYYGTGIQPAFRPPM